MNQQYTGSASNKTGDQEKKTSTATTSSTSSGAPTQKESLANLLQQLRVRKRVPFATAIASLHSAIETIWSNRTRAVLTMLGIFIGNAGVIAALILTQSASAYITSSVAGLGADTIIVQNGSSTSLAGVLQKNQQRSLTLQDVQALSRLPHSLGISPDVSFSTQIVYGDQNWKASIQGVSTAFPNIQGWEIAQGFWFSDSDDAAGRPVAVLGNTVVQNLFGGAGDDAIGKDINIGGQIFRVVGTLIPKGGFRQDNTIFVPFDTARFRLGFSGLYPIDSIDIEVDSPDNVSNTVQTITATLELNHHIRSGQTGDFQVTTSTQDLQQAEQEESIVTVLLVGIAAISLTVGGIGIMNVLLVSVSQRKREIGVRMSLGARKRDILSQFLVEALILCLTGGGLGLLGGMLVGFGISTAFGISPVITLVTVLIPFTISTIIAFVFGIYPALRAANLDPIVALQS